MSQKLENELANVCRKYFSIDEEEDASENLNI